MRKHEQSNNDQTRSTPSHQNMDNANSANRVNARKKIFDWMGLSNIIVSLSSQLGAVRVLRFWSCRYFSRLLVIPQLHSPAE
jgi:hypothetical protein